jgi:uncharacterized membrane protein
MAEKKMTDPIFREPRWPALVAMVAAGLLYLALPERLSVGPGWLLLVIVMILMVPLGLSYRRKRYEIAHNLTFLANGVITLSLVGSLAILIQGLPRHLESPAELLRSATSLWVSNVLVFALWYWKLDAGGPLGRDRSRGHIDSSFLFPQMLDAECDPEWSPQFMDYLFLAFNTSTAFSPTDTAALSRWAKAGMMLQSLISLTIVALLAARAVNIL